MKKTVYHKPKARFWAFLLILTLAVFYIFTISNSFVNATSGVPKIISYQGRLTDASGNMLGGSSGTTYYFKFSIWDSPISNPQTGNRLWPTTSPNITTSTVTSGVFNVNIGDTANGYPDTLTYDFYSNSDVYLEVQVSSNGSSFETLSPRQRISASGFAINAENVSGGLTVSSTADYTFDVINEGTGIANLQVEGLVSSTNAFFTIATTTNLSVGTLTGILQGSSGVIGTSARMTSINNIATSTGSLIVGKTDATGWYGLSAGADNLCLLASSTATLGVVWGSCAVGGVGISNLNGQVGATQTFATSGLSGFSILSAGDVHTFTIATSSGTQSGFLSAGDWTIFNNKQDTISFPIGYASTTGVQAALTFPLPFSSSTHVTILGSTYLGATTVNGSTTLTNLGVQTFNGATGTISYSAIQSFNGSTSSTQTLATAGATGGFSWNTTNGVHTLTIATSSASTDGLLTSTDWNTFNNKQNTLTFPLSYASTTGAQAEISFPIPVASTSLSASQGLNLTGNALTNIGVLSLTGGGGITVDKATGTITLGSTGLQSSITFPIPVASTSLSVTGPLSLSTNQLSMPTSTASQSGFLSSTDWNTFNSKSSQLWGLSGSNLFASSTSWNVGIGTTTPANALDVNGSSTIRGQLYLPGIGSNNFLGLTTNGQVETKSAYQTINGMGGGTTYNLYAGAGLGIVNNNSSSTLTNLGVNSLGNATGTITLQSPLTMTSGVLSMPTSTASQSGFLSSADWNTFNNKQSQLWGLSGSNLFASSTSWNVGIGTTTPIGIFSVASSTTGTNLFTVNANGNVGIGTSTPSAKLSVESTNPELENLFILSSNSNDIGNFFVVDTGGGLVYDPSAGYLNPMNFGNNKTQIMPNGSMLIINPNSVPSNAYILRVQETGIDRFVIDGAGNVGIGTTTPAYKLDVWGDLRILTSSTLGNVISGVWQGTPITSTYLSSSTQLWSLSGSNLFASSTTWNVGIGTTTPTSTLTVVGSTSTPSFSAYASLTSTTPAFVIALSGKVGIGTASPTQALTISGILKIDSDSAHAAILHDGNGNVAFRSLVTGYWIDSANATAFQIGSGKAIFTANGSSKMARTAMLTDQFQVSAGTYNGTNVPTGLFEVSNGTTGLFNILSSGNVGIGTTTPSSKLTVNGDLLVLTSSTLGNVISGVWNGTAIADAYISSAGTWNAKQNVITLSTSTFRTATAMNISSSSGTWTLNYPEFINDIAAISTSTGNLIIASSTGWKGLAIGSNGKVLMASSTASNGMSWETVSASASAGGSNTQLQFNNGGVFGGDANLTWASSTKLLTITGSSTISGNFSIGTTTLSTLFTIATTSNIFNVLSNGHIGIGTSTPQVALHIGNTSTTQITSPSNSLMVSGDVEVAGSAYLGPMEFPANSGVVSWIDMPVSSSTATSTIESYTARLGGTSVLTIYGLAAGAAGGITNPRVGIGTTTPAFGLQIAGDIVPTISSLYALGSTTLKWANIYTASSTVGDLIFGNDFRITEDYEIPQSLVFKNQKGDEIMRLDENGNLIIKGSIFASSSMLIGASSSALLGISSSTLIGINTSTIEQSSSSSSLFSSLIDGVKQAFTSVGLAIENGIARVKELITDTLFAKKARIEKLEMVDSVTREIYCTWIENGEWQKVKGECDTTSAPPEPGNQNTGGQENNSTSTLEQATSTESAPPIELGQATSTEEILEPTATSTGEIAPESFDAAQGEPLDAAQGEQLAEQPIEPPIEQPPTEQPAVEQPPAEQTTTSAEAQP